MFSIKFTEEGKITLQKLHIGIQKEIKVALKKLATGELKGKALTAELLGFYTLTVSNHRAIYSQNAEQIIVHHVGHRKDIYLKFKV